MVPAVPTMFPLPQGEKLLLVTRKHWFILASKIIATSLVGILLCLSAAFLLLFFTFHPNLFTTTILSILIITTTLFAKATIDWHCHLYIVTSRKILEMCYSPLFSHTISDVLLDQVRTTEVDIKKDGIFNELIDRGNVTVTFDRPTHQEEFVLADIARPDKTGMFLADMLINAKRSDATNTFWYRQKDEPNRFRFMEEIFPGYAI